MSLATTSTLQIPGTEAKESLGQHTLQTAAYSKQQNTAPAPAAATATEKGWITPASPCAAPAFLYLSLVPSSSLLAWPLVLGISCF